MSTNRTRKFISLLKSSIFISITLIIVCGIIYPLIMTGISQIIFPKQANGSMIQVNGKAVGSELIGQDFTDPRFMKCRPSAVNYNVYKAEDKENSTHQGVLTGSDNLAVSNPKLEERVKKDLNQFLQDNPNVRKDDIPADLLTASGSGLDPHISLDSAKAQVPRLIENTNLTSEKLNKIINNNTEGKFLGIFGEETVNVLKVNLAIAKELGVV